MTISKCGVLVVAFALLAFGCSAHSAVPSPRMPNAAAPQVYQGYGGGQTWTTIKAVPAHSQGINVAGLLYWYGEDMTALERGFTDAVLMIGPGGAVTSIPLPNGDEVDGDAVGPDGNLWATTGFGPIESVTPGGVVTRYPLPSQNSPAFHITAGPDGALWFDEDGFTNPELGRITTSGVITEYPYPPGVTDLPNIVSGSDGNLWATEGQGVIYKITTSGVFTSYQLATHNNDLVEDAGDVWTMTGSGLTSIDPTGAIASYAPPSGFGTDMGVGSDGNLWALENGSSSALGTFNVTTHQFSTVAPPPPSDKFQGGQFIAGPDSNLWTDSCCGTSLLVYLWHSIGVSPTSLVIAAPGDQSPLTVTETNYSGNWSGSSNNKSAATVARSRKQGTLTVTAVGVGSCVLTIGDTDHNTVKIKVTVN
jgi:streptogramin lyase